MFPSSMFLPKLNVADIFKYFIGTADIKGNYKIWQRHTFYLKMESKSKIIAQKIFNKLVASCDHIKTLHDFHKL